MHQVSFVKGYGRVFKSVLLSPDLTPAQKGVYAYLCGYANENGTAFPHQKKMCLDLRIGEDTLRKHLQTLQKQKILWIEKQSTGNFYHLQKQSGGWGKVSKELLLDSAVSLQAKGLFALLAAFAGSDHEAHPHRGTLLRAMAISKDTFYKYLHELTSKHYLVVESRRDGSKFTASRYILQEGFISKEKSESFSKTVARQENSVSEKRPVPNNKVLKKTNSTTPRKTKGFATYSIRSVEKERNSVSVFGQMRNEISQMEHPVCFGVRGISASKSRYLQQCLTLLESESKCQGQIWSYTELYETLFSAAEHAQTLGILCDD